MNHPGYNRRPRAEPEYQMQSAVFKWARLPCVQAQYPGLNLLEGSMNGVKLTATQAAKAKAAGMLRGAHDIRLPVPRGGFTGLSVELKAGKNKPTDEQIAYGEALIEQGWKVLYCWDNWEEVKDEIERYMRLGPSNMLNPVAVRGSIQQPLERKS